jgi:regulator of sigma E protease
MDQEQLASEPQPWEYRAKPAWQRFLVLIAGVTMNVVLAFFIYCGISFTYGSKYISNEDLTYGYEFAESAERLGFQDGDRVISIEGEHIKDVKKIGQKILLADGNCEVKVLRNGVEHTFVMNEVALKELRNSDDLSKSPFYGALVPFVVDEVSSESAQSAGLQTGDRVIGIGDKTILHFGNYAEEFAAKKDSNVELKVVRGADTLALNVPVNAEGKIGVKVKEFTLEELTKIHTQNYGFFESFGAGARLTGNAIKGYWDQLVLIVKPDTGLYKHVGGFISIGNIFPSQWDWEQFWYMTAFLSIILAVMNIIPIPGLDGGHMLFTFWEMVTRRKVSEKVLTIAQYIGMGLILALVLFANGNDIYKLFQ